MNAAQKSATCSAISISCDLSVDDLSEKQTLAKIFCENFNFYEVVVDESKSINTT